MPRETMGGPCIPITYAWMVSILPTRPSRRERTFAGEFHPSEQRMSSFSLKDKFPDLEPISHAPSLHTINGIGTGIYGRRDYDEETGTYVTTYCFCVLFIPVLALGAYRVADAPTGGYYFLGKAPMSALSKAWNALFVAVAVAGIGGGGFLSWYNLPDNVAQRQIAAAEKDMAAGDHAGAAKTLEQVALGRTKQAGPARERLEKWLAA